jgi:hypothetical protein
MNKPLDTNRVRSALVMRGALSGGAGVERRDDVSGVAIERDAGSVVAHGRSVVRVAGGFLHVAERDAGVEGGGDEAVAKGVRSNSLGDPSSTGDTRPRRDRRLRVRRDTMYGSPTRVCLRTYRSEPGPPASADRVAEDVLTGAGELAVLNWEPGQSPVARVALPEGDVRMRASWYGITDAQAHPDNHGGVSRA